MKRIDPKLAAAAVAYCEARFADVAANKTWIDYCLKKLELRYREFERRKRRIRKM